MLCQNYVIEKYRSKEAKLFPKRHQHRNIFCRQRRIAVLKEDVVKIILFLYFLAAVIGMTKK
jgi:hypothetical protein